MPPTFGHDLLRGEILTETVRKTSFEGVPAVRWSRRDAAWAGMPARLANGTSGRLQ
jgi:hypothetical protein